MQDKIELIPLKSVLLEESFRTNIYDQSLTDNIKNTGLREPLIVESDDKSQQYILVEGYRRYRSLLELNKTHVECIAEPLTSRKERYLKRLSSELHHKRRTGFEMEELLEAIKDEGYDVNTIATLTDKHPNTIRRYLKTSKMDKRIRDLGKKKKIGKDALTEIYFLKNVSKGIRNKLIKGLFRKDFVGKHVDSIKRVAKVSVFKDLSERSKMNSIQEAIDMTSYSNDYAQKTVFKEYIKKKDNPLIQGEVYNYLLEELDGIDNSYFHSNFINGLDIDQKVHIYQILDDWKRQLGLKKKQYYKEYYYDETTNKNYSQKQNVVINIRGKENNIRK